MSSKNKAVTFLNAEKRTHIIPYLRAIEVICFPVFGKEILKINVVDVQRCNLMNNRHYVLTLKLVSV